MKHFHNLHKEQHNFSLNIDYKCMQDFYPLNELCKQNIWDCRKHKPTCQYAQLTTEKNVIYFLNELSFPITAYSNSFHAFNNTPSPLIFCGQFINQFLQRCQFSFINKIKFLYKVYEMFKRRIEMSFLS